MQTYVDQVFDLRHNEGDDKVVTLSEALKRNVQPGMSLYCCQESSASIMELSRLFWGERPRFTLVTALAAAYALVPVYGGLVDKLVTTYAGHVYPRPGPASLLQKAIGEGHLKIEYWSLCSLQQRLMAGACGLGFMPTASVRGSSMAEENKEAFADIEDPFGQGKTGVVRSLIPDVSIVHGLAADRYGNTILTSPYTELWGARCGKKVLVTVEKIVSTDFIRKHSPLVKIPGCFVDAVSEVPLGAHPYGLNNLGLMDFSIYRPDYEFLAQFRDAAEGTTFHNWIKEWVLDTSDHDSYLHKLGGLRIGRLKRKTSKRRRQMQRSEGYRPGEMLVIATARELKSSVLKQGHKVILAGGGASALASFLAHRLLQNDGYHVDLVVGNGEIGLSPRPWETHHVLETSHVEAAKMLTDTVENYSWIIGGRENKSLSCLGGAEIDKFGNINTTRIGGVHLVGAGGANDAINSRETIVAVRQSPKSFVDSVAYVSCPGERVKTVVSQLGVFKKQAGRDELVLTALLPLQNTTLKEMQGQIRKNTGWDLKVASTVEELSPPTDEELMILRALDPDMLYT